MPYRVEFELSLAKAVLLRADEHSGEHRAKVTSVQHLLIRIYRKLRFDSPH